MLKLGVSDFDECRPGPYGNTEASFLDHQLVIGTVPDREHIGMAESEFFTRIYQRVALRSRIDDGVADFSAELPAREYQSVRLDAVKPYRPRDRLGERQKSTRDQEATRAARPHRLNQGLRAGRHIDALVETTPHLALIDARKEANPVPQCPPEVDIAAHGRVRDARHPILETSEVSQLVDAFLVDDRRIHVSDQQLSPARLIRLDDDVDSLDRLQRPARRPQVTVKGKVGGVALVDPVRKACSRVHFAQQTQCAIDQPVIQPSCCYQRRNRHEF